MQLCQVTAILLWCNHKMKSSKIKRITPVGVKNVFDLEVEKDHNYFANGILAHNCSYHELLDYYGKKYNDDLYRVKDTFISYKHRRLLMYPAGPNKKTLRGRCLVGSTIINTNKGFVKLSNLISKDGQHPVDNLFVDSHTGQQKVTHTFMESVSETIKIKTTNGFTIEGTLEHPIYIKSANGDHEWKRLEDIVNGDAIMSMGHEQNPVWGLSSVTYDVSKIPDEYPKELLSATKDSNKNFIENLLATYAKEDFESLAITATESFLSDLQVILFHGFLVLSQNEGETLKIQKSQLNNLQSSGLSVLFGLEGNTVSNINHYEVVCSKKLVVKEQFVYDVTVPQGHAFMANGFVSHNTRFLCLAEGTLVNIDRGLCKIEDVKAGDYTYFGKYKRKILSTTASGVQKIFKVLLSNGMQISCTSDHRFLAIFNNKLKEFWVKAKDLKPYMHVLVTLGGSFAKDTIKVDFDGKTFELDEKFARLLALLVKSTYYKIKDDTRILKLLSEIFEGEIATVVEGGIVLTNLQSKVLESFGYNFCRNVPQALHTSPEKVVREFLIECFSEKKLNISLDAMQEYRSILLKFGVIASSIENTILLSDYEYSKLTGENYYPTTIEFSPYNTPYNLKDKKSFYMLDKGIVYCKVLSVIDTNTEGKTFDVCVDCDDHAFTANGFVVHNSAIDEIGWFDNQNDGKVKMDATQVYVALDRSLLTVRAASRRLIMQGFDDIANGYAFNVSSPSSARDKIVELVSQSKNSKKIFGFKCATWEMNPNITKDDLSEEYAKNPVDAERDYACNPPLSDNAFIPSFTSIEDCFIGKPNKVRYKYSQRTMRDGTVTRFAKVDEIAKSTKPNVLAIDAGYSGNSFGAACMHQHEGTPILNSLMEVMPNPGVPLNHALIFREALHTMIRERNVKVLLADRWQSIKLLQDAEIEFEGLIVMQYSLKYNDFWMLKQVMFDAEIVFPKIKRPMDEILKFDQSKYPYCFTDPVEHFAVQCITVRDMGNTIAKGDGLTDDLFRAVSLAAWAFQSGQFEEILDGDGEEEGSRFTGALGYMAGRSSATSANSNEVHKSNGKVVGYMTSKR